jgi:hypothetical protein
MHLPWLAQQYQRTCADCGHTWRVPRQFARRRMRISFFRGLLTGGGFRTGGGRSRLMVLPGPALQRFG